MIKYRLQRGLLLLEIVIGLLILAIILPLLVPNWGEIVGRNVSERTIEETLTMWDASRNYYARNSEWPDESNNCADALTVLEAGDFIGNVGPDNAWDGAIVTSCTPNTAVMEITQTVVAEWRSYILGQLPASSEVGAAGVATVIPAPGTSAQTFTHLSRTAVAGRPELNRMETNIDMDGNNIDGAGTVTAEEVTLSTTGVELSSLGSWEQGTPGTNFSKPTCPGGKTSDLNIIPVRICTNPSSTLPIERLDFQITDFGTYWRVQPQVFAQDNFYYPSSSACATFKVQGFCR